jgi:hypothetical protein
MIASFRHGFVFIKSKKTGGSTAECALAPLCGAEDIVTPAGFDEAIQPGGEARNFTADPAVQALYDRTLAHGDDPDFAVFLDIDRRCRAAGDCHTHMTAQEVRAKLDPGFWASAFKFSIERHPYEKAVSQAWFSWARQGRPDGDFAAFLDEQVRKGPYANGRFYRIEGRPVLDRVLRYERLDEELREVAGRFGLALPEPLPRIKGGFRADRRPAAEVLSDDQKAAIYERCRDEFELMGYRP